MFKLKGINYLLTLVGLQLLCPANLLLYFLKTFEEKHVEVRVDPDPAVRLADSPVLEHETHPFFFKLEGGDGVPGELDNLILQTPVLPAGLQSKSIKGDDWHHVALFPSIGSAVGEDNSTVSFHLPDTVEIVSHPCRVL